MPRSHWKPQHTIEGWRSIIHRVMFSPAKWLVFTYLIQVALYIRGILRRKEAENLRCQHRGMAWANQQFRLTLEMIIQKSLVDMKEVSFSGWKHKKYRITKLKCKKNVYWLSFWAYALQSLYRHQISTLFAVQREGDHCNFGSLLWFEVITRGAWAHPFPKKYLG